MINITEVFAIECYWDFIVRYWVNVLDTVDVSLQLLWIFYFNILDILDCIVEVYDVRYFMRGLIILKTTVNLFGSDCTLIQKIN